MVYIVIEIKEIGFGYIVVGNKRYEEDIVICNDKIMIRPKHLSKKYVKIYGHTPLSLDELSYLLNNCRNIETIIIGTGQYGALPIMEEVFKELEKPGLTSIIKPTPQVISFINKFSGKKKYLAILHLTC